MVFLAFLLMVVALSGPVAIILLITPIILAIFPTRRLY